jgi:hypothetical protein
MAGEALEVICASECSHELAGEALAALAAYLARALRSLLGRVGGQLGAGCELVGVCHGAGGRMGVVMRGE